MVASSAYATRQSGLEGRLRRRYSFRGGGEYVFPYHVRAYRSRRYREIPARRSRRPRRPDRGACLAALARAAAGASRSARVAPRSALRRQESQVTKAYSHVAPITHDDVREGAPPRLEQATAAHSRRASHAAGRPRPDRQSRRQSDECTAARHGRTGRQRAKAWQRPSGPSGTERELY